MKNSLKPLSLPGPDKQSILSQQGNPIPVAGYSNFNAAECFVINTSPSAVVKIARLGDGFVRLFVPMVESTTAGTLRSFDLNKPALDATILSVLGPNAEVSLADIWSLLKEQPNGESGPLLVSSNPKASALVNMFYVRNIRGDLCVIRVRWRTGNKAWHVDSFPADDPISWAPGRRIFSRV